MNLPNRITVARILLVPVFSVVLLEVNVPTGPICAFIIFLIAAISDKVDGAIARKRGLVTLMGKFLDPLADKLLVISSLFCLTVLGKCSPYIGIIITSRELIITSFRIVAMGAGHELSADKYGKTKALLQYVAICVATLSVAYEELALFGQILLIIAAVVTVTSGWRYISHNWSSLESNT